MIIYRGIFITLAPDLIVSKSLIILPTTVFIDFITSDVDVFVREDPKETARMIFFQNHFLQRNILDNRTAHIRHQCRKTTVLSCQRCLINTGIEKMNNI